MTLNQICAKMSMSFSCSQPLREQRRFKSTSSLFHRMSASEAGLALLEDKAFITQTIIHKKQA